MPRWKAWGRRTGWTLLAVLALAVAVRACLPYAVLRYVNRVLAGIPDYESRIGDIDLHLWRGAYQIHDLKMVKRKGDPKKPFLVAPVIDFSMEWKALFHGRLVGEVVMNRPELNFIKAKSDADSQYRFSEQWIEQGKKLFPFQFNRIEINGGRITYLDRMAEPSVPLDLQGLKVLALNISNVVAKPGELPADIKMNATIFDSGSVVFTARADLNREPQDFSANFKMTGVELTHLNPLSRHYANFDFASGRLDVFAEIEAKGGKFKGYIKPLFENIQLIEKKEEFDNPFEAIWEGMVSGFLQLFKNQPKDRFATRIPLSGTLQDPKAGVWPTIFNVLRNAFIEAFRPELENSIPDKPAE